MTTRGILGPHVYEDVPFHQHEYSEISGELIVSEAQITSLSASKITSGTITAQTITMATGGVIVSDDFVTGPGGAGYQLSAGLAEFNNVTVRGSIFSGAGSDIDYTHVSNVAIATGDIVDLAVTAGKIDNLTITAAQIANGTITATQIDDLTITAGKIGNLEITAAQIDNLTITGGKIGASEIDDSKISDVDWTKIDNISVTNADIVSLSAGKITTGTLNVAVSLTSGGNFYAPSSSAARRIEILGGTSPKLNIRTDQGSGGTAAALQLMGVGGVVTGRLKPADSGGTEFAILEGTQEYLYISAQNASPATTLELVGVGRRPGDSGFGSHDSLNHAIGLLTKGAGDTPVSIYQNEAIASTGTHVLIHSNHSANANRFHLKMITKSGTDQVNFEFRMDGRADARGSAVGWNTTSDEGLKKWLKGVDPADMRRRIEGVEVQQWAFKGEQKDQPRKIGPTAQNVQPLFPRSVSEASDGMLGMNTDETVWALVSVVQDLLADVAELKARLAEAA
jgi:hypothetical protein